MKYLFVYIVVVGLLFCQESTERTIQLRNGDKISGTVTAETDSSVILKTSFGEITVFKKDIKLREITVYLKDGNKISGEVILQDEKQLIIKSTFGTVTIVASNIDRTSEQGEIIPGTTAEQEFYHGQERLADVFFDPTGYTLEKGSVYLSGLSWGVGLTDNIDISSSYWRYFLADLNIRPKMKIYSSGNIEVEEAWSVGFHLHAAGPTGKSKFTKNQYSYTDYLGNTIVMPSSGEWRTVGDFGDYFIWTELFTGFTRSYLKADKKGRISYHFGASVILHKESTMPRAWIAVENDISESFKILGQIYYDPFQPSYRQRYKNSDSGNPFDLDFGFVYAFSKNFRIGIHYQPYVILFYYEF